jgi:hypothetical protein
MIGMSVMEKQQGLILSKLIFRWSHTFALTHFLLFGFPQSYVEEYM